MVQFFLMIYQIGVDFAMKVLNWDKNTIVRLQLWDIAGHYFAFSIDYFVEIERSNS